MSDENLSPEPAAPAQPHDPPPLPADLVQADPGLLVDTVRGSGGGHGDTVRFVPQPRDRG